MCKPLGLVAVIVLISACASLEKMQHSEQPSLAQAYLPHFLMGAAIDEDSYKTHEALLVRHYNSLTTENEMKFEHMQEVEGVFTFDTADAMLDFAEQHHMAVRGHALVWHRQTPNWVFVDDSGKVVDRAMLLQRMQSHITEVMTHFKGRVDYWDVVNEAIMDDGTLRTGEEEAEDQRSQWYAILQEDYIAEAFRMAHAADPEAKLYYNDYYNHLPARQDAIYALLKGLLEKGVPIHGVGLQCHLRMVQAQDPSHEAYYQSPENLEKAIKMYASLGLDVQITEMDVSVYEAGKTYTPDTFYTPETLGPGPIELQSKRYGEFFAMFRRNSHLISSVTTWGIADDNTWLSEFDSGRQDFPLLFDLEHKPKPAFYRLMEF